MVLALLTLSNDGCRSLHHHSVAAERNIKEEENRDGDGDRQTGRYRGRRCKKKERMCIM